jgi:hypothetical protein
VADYVGLYLCIKILQGNMDFCYITICVEKLHITLLNSVLGNYNFVDYEL